MWRDECHCIEVCRPAKTAANGSSAKPSTQPASAEDKSNIPPAFRTGNTAAFATQNGHTVTPKNTARGQNSDPIPELERKADGRIPREGNGTKDLNGVNGVAPIATKDGNGTAPSNGNGEMKPGNGVKAKKPFWRHVVDEALAFFAHWFGAARFDKDGDGDLDWDDIQSRIAERKQRMAERKQRAKAKPESKADAKAKAKAVGRNKTGDFDGDGDVDMEDKINDIFEDQLRGDVDMMQESQYTPIFICVYSLIIMGLWWSGAVQDYGWDKFTGKLGGLESFYKGETKLRTNYKCLDLRNEPWRWFTYQFTHAGIGHSGFNTVMNLFLGVPLEKIHGPLRLFLMYQVGVFGGSMCLFVTDVHTSVVGCSGGVYSLYGMHLATLFLNWAEDKYRKPTLFVLMLLWGCDMMILYNSDEKDRTSHAVHFGGYLAGTIIGILLGKNFVKTRMEKVFQALTFTVGMCLIALCITWTFTVWPPQTFWESSGWCWRMQVWSPLHFGDFDFHCVSCNDRDCAWKYLKPNDKSGPGNCTDCVNYSMKVPCECVGGCDSFIDG